MYIKFLIYYKMSYFMGTGGSFFRGKTAGVWSWPLTFIYCWEQEYMDFYLHSMPP